MCHTDWEGPLTLDSILRYPDPRLRQQNAKIGVFDAKVTHADSTSNPRPWHYHRDQDCSSPPPMHTHVPLQLARLASEMLEVMYMDDGVGLAAPQVGVNVRLMVFNPTGLRERRNSEVVLVNPRVVSGSKRMEMGEEGCLSFKDAQVTVRMEMGEEGCLSVRDA